MGDPRLRVTHDRCGALIPFTGSSTTRSCVVLRYAQLSEFWMITATRFEHAAPAGYHCVTLPFRSAMRRLLFALATFLLAAPAAAAVLLEVQPDPELNPTPYLPIVLQELESRGEFVLDPNDERDAWSHAVVISAEPEQVAGFAIFHDRIPRGRDQFFENEFAASIATLAPGLELLERDPSVLAFRPDLAPGFFDGMLTLIRAYDAMGDSEASSDALARVSLMMWAAEPDPGAYPPGFIQKYRRSQGLMPTRALIASWTRDECRLRVNGFVISDESGADVRLPSGAHFLVLECGDERSHVVRLAGDRAETRFDLAFDRASTFEQGRPAIRPQDDNPRALLRIGRQAAHLLREDAAYMVRLAEPAANESTGWLELARVSSSGEFRAVRVVVGDMNTDARIHAAVEYLVTGQISGGVAVWHPENGWTEPTGIVVVENSPSVVPWILGGAAIAAGAVAVIFELRTSESVSDVNACADQVPTGCDPDNLPALRSDARSSRAIANAGWITAGTMATAALVSALVTRPRRDGRASASSFALTPLRDGVGVSFSWIR